MVDFEFKRSSRHCCVTNRAINRGEAFFSVLLEQGEGELQRNDISTEAWTGPPPGCVGWWRSKVPELEKGRVYWAPNEVLLAFFQHVSEQSEHLDTAYVMSLLLVRKRILQWKETIVRDGHSFLRLLNARNNAEFEIRQLSLTPERIVEIQSDLAEKLFTDQRLSQSESSEPE
jgi:hypothetical protein